MKRKKRLKLDSCRAVDLGREPPSTRAAMNPSSLDPGRLEQRAVVLLEPAREGGQIGPVSGKRIGRKASLHPNRIEEALQGGVRGIARRRCPRA